VYSKISNLPSKWRAQVMLSGKRNHNDLFQFLHVIAEFMSLNIFIIFIKKIGQGLTWKGQACMICKGVLMAWWSLMLITVQPVRLQCTFPGNAHKKSKNHYSGQRELPNVGQTAYCLIDNKSCRLQKEHF
jgi:hypothetical protein